MKQVRTLPLLPPMRPFSWPVAAGGRASQTSQKPPRPRPAPTWESRTPSEAFQGIQGLRRPL